MDAGLADNFGIQDALKFAYTFQDWIKKHTSGIVLLTIRDSEKTYEIQKKINPFTNLENHYPNKEHLYQLAQCPDLA